MAGFKKSGIDLDSLLEPIGSFTKRANVNYTINGVDISNNYCDATFGAQYGATGFLSNGVDIGTLFAGLGTTVLSGALYTFGVNNRGQLGDNTTVNKSSPVQTIAGGTNWSSVAGNRQNTVAIKTDGTLWSWGYYLYGNVGDGANVNRSSPVQTISGGTNWKLISSGQYNHAAIKTDGTLWSWGQGSFGQLGTNTTTNRSSPVQTISGGTNWKEISIDATTAAIKTDGTLWLWGINLYGSMGINAPGQFSSPVQTIAGGTNWKSVSVSARNGVAIKTDGTLWTWGRGSGGTLGDNTTVNKSSPVQTIAGGTNWSQVSLNTNSDGTVAAIKTDGTLWVWGANSYGQLGDNTRISKSSPVQTVSAGTNWKSASGRSWGHVQAIKTDGTLWLWGRNSSGQLGDNTISSKSSPIQTISGGTNWKLVSAGAYTTFAIS
jgi:alpha-tubulin suppressor-like RCC1 family protein